MVHPMKICAVALALAASGSVQAETVITTGSYAAGEELYRSGGVTLGPGTYRFSLATTAPLAELYGGVEKQSYYLTYCDFRDGNGEFYCGGDSVPSLPLFDLVTPTLYQLQIKVNPYVETLRPDDFVVRTIEFDSCCNFSFDLIAGNAGSYSLSYAAIPEPSAWAILLLGFGAVGGSMRYRRRPSQRVAFAAA